jgi:hypothetical protein
MCADPESWAGCNEAPRSPAIARQVAPEPDPPSLPSASARFALPACRVEAPGEDRSSLLSPHGVTGYSGKGEEGVFDHLRFNPFGIEQTSSFFPEAAWNSPMSRAKPGLIMR